MTNLINTQLIPTSVERSIQPLLENISSLKRFKGYYTVVSCVERIDKHSRAYWIMKLSDISTSINVYCFNMNDFMMLLVPNSIVHIEATLKSAEGHQYVRCAFLQTIEKAQCNALLNINALASCYCPLPELLTSFKKLVESIQSFYLKQFLVDVLVNNDVGIYYLQCPASCRHHHNYSGGLLAHSVDVANRLINENKFSDTERDIAIASALVHDVGKTKTLTAHGTRTSLGMVVDHDELTLEICALALQKLDKSECQSALLLRHILTCASPGNRFGYQPITHIASKLQAADKKSASEHYVSTSFVQIA